MQQHYSFLDRLIIESDKGLRTLMSAHRSQRSSPSSNNNSDLKPTSLSDTQRRHSAGLMRVNHCGEVCAQALYQGQALSARRADTQQAMQQAAAEEIDHLVWCEQRLQQLNSRPSLLNPLWYGASFSLGAITGLLGDKLSLGFVAATEQQVCEHLENHLQQLPEQDRASRQIITQMLIDERQHGEQALAYGGYRFPSPIRRLMTLSSKLMTTISYYF